MAGSVFYCYQTPQSIFFSSFLVRVFAVVHDSIAVCLGLPEQQISTAHTSISSEWFQPASEEWPASLLLGLCFSTAMLSCCRRGHHRCMFVFYPYYCFHPFKPDLTGWIPPALAEGRIFMRVLVFLVCLFFFCFTLVSLWFRNAAAIKQSGH